MNEEDFAVTFSGKAWQACEKIDSVDGTIEMEACSIQRPNLKFLGLIHGHLSRVSPNGLFAVKVSLSQVIEIIEDAMYEWSEEEVLESSDIYHPKFYRIKDARWRMKDCSVAETHASEYAGGARDILETELKLGSSQGMQDWPLEVSNRSRVEEFCNFYDRKIDSSVKFDIMQLALFSYDDYLRYSIFSDRKPTQLDNTLSKWFDCTLRCDFALHGNTIAYWATLDRESNDPEFSLTDPQFVFAISGKLRRIWNDSQIPIDVYWDAL
ncbi:hypothetical protein [Chamaesiphon polymorphus]|uniref:hypothetical protein n=1 Tax=Chamaesiphon polymorphus TaxID=2107691 RepID=UPI0011B20520|nr:hypothetical protein [Chamaesiphon polymorphus]